MITEGMVLLSSAQLRELITSAVTEAIQNVPEKSTVKQVSHVYGLDGLANLLKCSHPTAQRIKNGLPKDSYTQAGRKIVFQVEAVLKALNKRG